jgi:hypothetical protein
VLRERLAPPGELDEITPELLRAAVPSLAEAL